VPGHSSNTVHPVPPEDAAQGVWKFRVLMEDDIIISAGISGNRKRFPGIIDTAVSMGKGGAGHDIRLWGLRLCIPRVGAVRECPFCEKTHIRTATEEEARRLKLLLELGKPTLQIREEQTL